MSEETLKAWAFRRPYCTPEGGILVAKTATEAIALVNAAYGCASGTTVYCAETGEHKDYKIYGQQE